MITTTTSLKILFIVASSIFLVGVGILVFPSRYPTEVHGDISASLPIIKTPPNFRVEFNNTPVKLTRNGFPLKYSRSGDLVPMFGESISRVYVGARPPNKPIYLGHKPDQVRKGQTIISDVVIPSGKHVTLATHMPYEFKYSTPIVI